MRINNKTKYEIKSPVEEEDFVIGSSGTNPNKTFNFSLSGILEFIKAKLGIVTVRTPVLGSYVLGFLPTGQVVRMPIEGFEASLIGNLEGDYYGGTIVANTFNDQNYI